MAKSESTKPRGYAVGKGKPPVGSRFKKGQSGNPEGARRHRRRADADVVTRLLEEKVSLVVDGRSRSMTKYEAIWRVVAARASQADVRAVQLLLDQKSREAHSAENNAQPVGPPASLLKRLEQSMEDWRRRDGIKTPPPEAPQAALAAKRKRKK